MKKKMNLKMQQSGFTLLEAMIVVSILAIIATLGINFYDDQKRRGFRSDAIIAIQTTAQLQERYKTINGTYSDLVTIGGSANTDQGKYNITVTPANPTTTYTITATAIGAQTQDSDCAIFNLTNTGIRSSTNSGGTTTTGANSRCWPR